MKTKVQHRTTKTGGSFAPLRSAYYRIKHRIGL